MKRKGCRYRGLFLCLLIIGDCGLVRCQKPETPLRFIRNELRGDLAFADEPWQGKQAKPWLWRQGERGLVYRKDAGGLKDRLEGKHLVMVTFPQDSRLARELPRDPLTLVYETGSQDTSGYALVDVTEPAMRDALALAAHAASGHICGALESIEPGQSFAMTMEQDRSVLPAIYAESVRIPTVASLLEQTRQDSIAGTIQALEAMGTRFHRSVSGGQTPEKVRELLAQAAAERIPKLKIDLMETNQSSQSSVVAGITGETDDTTTVIIGAHLDSINTGGASSPAPGADDDASGVATLVEVMRVIGEAGIKFQRRIEFHAYGAEEVGILGSNTLAQKYLADQRRIAAMMQVDMNAWSEAVSDPTIHFVTTTTTPYLVRAAKDLLNAYLGGNFSTGTLTAGTSDHKAWFIRNYPVVFPFEKPSRYNPALHTDRDTSQTINNLPLTHRFSKLVLAFLAHEAGIIVPAPEVVQATDDTRKALSKDLKLAIVPSTATPDTYTVQIGVGSTIKSAEVCRVASRGSMVCSHERLVASSKGTLGERGVYSLNLSIPLSDGDRLAVFGYDQADKLVAQRSVKLNQKG